MSDDKQDPYVAAFIRASDDEHNTRQKLNTLVAHQKSELKVATDAAEFAAQEAAGRREEMYTQVFSGGIISPAVIDVLAPRHESTTCRSDDPSAGADRCVRCFMLNAIKDPHEFRGVKLSVHIERPKW